jgi:plasmid stability protein
MIRVLTSSIMARTTIDIDPSVLQELRRRGAREHKSMGTVASELLAQAMATQEDLEKVRPFRWIHRDLGRPKIDLEDKEALRRALNEDR